MKHNFIYDSADKFIEGVTKHVVESYISMLYDSPESYCSFKGVDDVLKPSVRDSEEIIAEFLDELNLHILEELKRVKVLVSSVEVGEAGFQNVTYRITRT